MQGPDQQAYDRGTSIFSPDGRLYQVEYAREAVKRGSPTVGVRTADGVVLVAGGRLRSDLQVESSVEKINKADDHVGIGSAGHAADARKLVDFARQQAQIEQLRYGQPIGVETLTKTITDEIQQNTQRGGTRPFGAALLIGGVDPDGKPRLFETDPSGTPYEWRAVAIGNESESIRDRLESDYQEEMSEDDGLELALRALAGANEGTLDPAGMSGAVVNEDGYRKLSSDDLHETLAEHGLLDE